MGVSWEQAGLGAPAGEGAVLDLGNRGWACQSTKLPAVQFPSLHTLFLTGPPRGMHSSSLSSGSASVPWDDDRIQDMRFVSVFSGCVRNHLLNFLA